MHPDSMGRVDPRSQVDEFLGVGTHFSPDMETADSLGHCQPGPRLQDDRQGQSVQGNSEIEQVLGIEKIPIAGRSLPGIKTRVGSAWTRPPARCWL